MNHLTAEDYFDLITGKSRGKHYSSSYFYVKHEKKNNNTTQDGILLNSGVGLPPTLNQDYKTKITDKRAKKRKIDPDVLRAMLENKR